MLRAASLRRGSPCYPMICSIPREVQYLLGPLLSGPSNAVPPKTHFFIFCKKHWNYIDHGKKLPGGRAGGRAGERAGRRAGGLARGPAAGRPGAREAGAERRETGGPGVRGSGRGGRAAGRPRRPRRPGGRTPTPTATLAKILQAHPFPNRTPSKILKHLTDFPPPFPTRPSFQNSKRRHPTPRQRNKFRNALLVL